MARKTNSTSISDAFSQGISQSKFDKQIERHRGRLDNYLKSKETNESEQAIWGVHTSHSDSVSVNNQSRETGLQSMKNLFTDRDTPKPNLWNTFCKRKN